MNDPDFLMRPEVEAVYKAIRNSDIPLSVYHLNDMVEKSRPQIYRDITYLIEKGHVEEVPSDRRAKFYRIKSDEESAAPPSVEKHFIRLWNPLLNIWQDPFEWVVYFRTTPDGKKVAASNPRAHSLTVFLEEFLKMVVMGWKPPSPTDYEAQRRHNLNAYNNMNTALNIAEQALKDPEGMKSRLLDDPKWNEDAIRKFFDDDSLGSGDHIA